MPVQKLKKEVVEKRMILLSEKLKTLKTDKLLEVNKATNIPIYLLSLMKKVEFLYKDDFSIYRVQYEYNESTKEYFNVISNNILEIYHKKFNINNARSLKRKSVLKNIVKICDCVSSVKTVSIKSLNQLTGVPYGQIRALIETEFLYKDSFGAYSVRYDYSTTTLDFFENLAEAVIRILRQDKNLPLGLGNNNYSEIYSYTIFEKSRKEERKEFLVPERSTTITKKRKSFWSKLKKFFRWLN